MNRGYRLSLACHYSVKHIILAGAAAYINLMKVSCVWSCARIIDIFNEFH